MEHRARHERHRSDEPQWDIENLGIACGLLQQMLLALREIAHLQPQFAAAFRSRALAVRKRLTTLAVVVDVLKHEQDSPTEGALMARASTLVQWLSEELNELSICATYNSGIDEPETESLH